jgi:uncharacterized membrane protein HdeD (DUF308 family)
MQLFLGRGVVALLWAIVFATASDSLTTTVGVLLVLYPGIDLVASLVDARAQPRGPARSLLLGDAVVSAVAAVALAVAATGEIADVLAVFGAWAAVTGIAQVVVARRRRAQLGTQWPMLLAGGLSALVGVFYIGTAAWGEPLLDPLAIYAAGGGAWFVLQAAVLAWRRHGATAHA